MGMFKFDIMYTSRLEDFAKFQCYSKQYISVNILAFTEMTIYKNICNCQLRTTENKQLMETDVVVNRKCEAKFNILKHLIRGKDAVSVGHSGKHISK